MTQIPDQQKCRIAGVVENVEKQLVEAKDKLESGHFVHNANLVFDVGWTDATCEVLEAVLDVSYGEINGKSGGSEKGMENGQ